MEQKGLSHRELAQQLGISRGEVTRWVNGALMANPSTESRAVALLGLDQAPNQEQGSRSYVPTASFWNDLDVVEGWTGVDDPLLAKQLGVQLITLTNWRTYPVSPQLMKAISEILEVGPAYWHNSLVNTWSEDWVRRFDPVPVQSALETDGQNDAGHATVADALSKGVPSGEGTTLWRHGLPDKSHHHKCWQVGAAVLIGVSDYKILHPLPTVKNNLDGMATILREGLGIPDDSIHVVDNPAHAAEVHAVVDHATSELGPDGGFLLYFAGHGLLDASSGELLLGLTGSDPMRTWSALSFSQIRKQVIETRTQSRIVILDACYSGAAMDFMSADPTGSTAIAGTYVMTSSDATALSLAPQDETYTSFTGEIIAALAGGISEGPETITIETLYREVRQSCLARGRPMPSQQNRKDGAQLPLMRNLWRGR
ncbi:caspase, EACC1-associated type [Streptomyces sp. SAS_275]|uniref:caspase, EACC1-associated type n=1 Tax=Streptomyces sp. SAS_275 TaxID=3412746 RepID=UPI00403C0CE5